ncbi:hypothetical protein SUGI_1493270 [Cryptomeria japonica]|uniref:Lipase n=1 Tax=Cryptomeria japonica TaxID=3369 RepID=A0AAD3RRN6_CRYJA|nr:uncharacterized protein LOC131872746 [Cryptomeria japonica]GLJ59125.1 hypothetical protein SUGI_1493270 [Cryptomeria japonica]
MRGFGAEVHHAKTKDGYYIHVVHIINPEIDRSKLRRPVIFNHGLLESSTIWLINANKVKPLPYEHQCGEISPSQLSANETQYLNGPMMLANHGFDVWLMSMRGTDWSLKHETLSAKDPEFWDYCLDDFALVDVPTVIDYVLRKTGSKKVGYIGHSQATFSIFGLLATIPSYADIVEPVIAVAPVAFFDHITSVARLLFLGTLTATNKDKHGPFPKEAKELRTTLASVCKRPGSFLKTACDLVEMLISGKGDKWLLGYFAHLPFFTSLKVLRHFGQLIQSKRYQMYDYGAEENKRIYGSTRSPSYNIKRIRSKSLCLISTKSDALSPPTDVSRFKNQLTVPLYKDIFIDKDFDHFDLITSAGAKELVFKPIMAIFEEFELNSANCVPQQQSSDYKEDFTNEIGLEYHKEKDQVENEATAN